jgi:hypothetical protein
MRRASVANAVGASYSAVRGDDRFYQAGEDVVDVPGDGDARGDCGCVVEALDIVGDGRGRWRA